MVRSHSSQWSPGGSQSSVTPVQGDLNPLMISMGSRHTHGAHTYMLTKTHAQKNKIRESETQSGKSSAATYQLDPHPPYSTAHPDGHDLHTVCYRKVRRGVCA